MTAKKAKTFEEKINAIFRYEEYTQAWWKKERFLSRFGYVPNDELESLLQLGQEIEQYAAELAHSLFTFGELLPEKDGARIDALTAAIREKYHYLDPERVNCLAARSTYNAVA
jgi:hypothetical protein